MSFPTPTQPQQHDGTNTAARSQPTPVRYHTRAGLPGDRNVPVDDTLGNTRRFHWLLRRSDQGPVLLGVGSEPFGLPAGPTIVEQRYSHRVSPDVEHEVSALRAAQLVEAGAVLLDVREPDEWQAGHAPAAVHLPMSTISQRADELPGDRQIVCVCHLGQRSALVSDALRRAGWDAVNLTGGMESWAAAGLPVVDHQGRAGSVV